MAVAPIFNFPDQSISETKKNMEWHIDHARHYLNVRNYTTSSTHRREQIEQLYRAYMCLMSKKEQELFEYSVTKPYGYSMGAEYQIYNLIEQKIEQLVGDYLDRPIRRKSYVLDKRSQNRKLDKKISYLNEEIFRELNEDFKKKYGIELDTENPDVELPENVEEFFEKEYKDLAEEISDDLIQKFLDVDKNKEVIVGAIIDFLISDEGHLSLIEENGILKWLKCHPLHCDGDLDPHKVVQDDHEYFINLHYLSENEIYNTYTLTKSQKSQIKEDFHLIQNLRPDQTLSSDYGNPVIDDKGWYTQDNNTFRIAVIEMVWKSRQTIRAKQVTTKQGQTITKVLNEKDRIRKGETEKSVDVEQPRFVVMTGPNVCLGWGIEKHRNYKVSDKKKCYLDVVSIYRQNTIGTSHIRSVAAKLYKMQMWASELLFEMRLAMRRNSGKVMIYDTAQTPKQYLKGKGNSPYKNALSRVMHHAKKDSFVFINSKDKANRYGFNQFTSIDLSTTGLINDLINGMALIEDLADKIVGLTPGRQGSAGQYSTATNIEAQRKASFSRTEMYYRPFDNFIQACLERVVVRSKKIYKEGDTIQYVLGDHKTKYIQMSHEFFDSDIGLYLNDGSKDARKKEIIDRASELALGNAQTEEMILSLIDVLSQDTAVESKAILSRAVDSAKKLREQSMQATQESEQAKLQDQKEARSEQNDLTERGQNKDVVVANIYADQKDNQIDQQENTKKMIKLAEIEKEFFQGNP